MESPDPLLESIIAHEQIEIQYQPLIEPGTGRVIGAEALARAAIARSADVLFQRAAAARLDERLSRLVQRNALRSAAVWEGPLKDLSLSINILPSEIARAG
jgi:EAL domain-containing protein (putative c-di-GMP-specific phosphodiesterase class I)